jgi:hypothetical protein
VNPTAPTGRADGPNPVIGSPSIGSPGRVSPGKPASGPRVGYGDGPTNRVAGPKPVAPTTTRPQTPKAQPKTGKGSGLTPTSGKTGKTGKSVANWRDVRRNDPKGSREILVATNLAGRSVDVGVGVASGLVGGVSAGHFRGGHVDPTWTCDPWGTHCWTSCSVSFGWCGWNSCWWYPWYWSWYYPCWWWYTRPYYYSDYCAYQPVTSVVYTEPEVVYVERPAEPVGEAAVAPQEAPAAEPGRIAPPAPAESPLTIAAQRYLELGDRAFREGRYTDAVQFYAKAVEFAPDQGALYLVLADALFASGDYHYGAYAVLRAIELDATLVESQIDKHTFYPDPQQFDTQLAALESYLNGHSSDRDARLVLALNYLFSARARDAANVIDSAGQAMTEDPAAQKILARARALAGN